MRRERRELGDRGSRRSKAEKERKEKNLTYVHGNVPGHVDVGFVFIHPDLGGPQGIAFGVVIYVIVVGLLGALDVSHSGAREDFHTAATLPHLDNGGKGERPGFN